LANIRKDFLHGVSKAYVLEYYTIVIENLKISNLLKNHKLARSIAQAMFYTWKTLLEYKCTMYGRKLIIVNPRNTSQTCSNCGTKLKEKLQLKDRTFRCPECSYAEDRDVNAARNILALA
jgi:putative transposase